MLPPSELDKLLLSLSGDPEPDERGAALSAIDDSAGLADYLKTERESLLAEILQIDPQESRGYRRPTGLAMSRTFSDLMDAVIARIFTLACRRAGANVATIPVAIVATGGYGRRELAAFSDIDLTFIPQRDGDAQTDRVIREMFTLVMDICIARCGLEVGYAYRLMEDCGKLDHQTSSGLLDARLIVGSNRLFIQFEDAYWAGFNPTDFIFTKLSEREKALEKWGTTPRVVEPQLKEGPGGLRDLQTSVWLTQARWQFAAARVRGSRSFDTLVSKLELSADDAVRLAAAKEQLFQVRNVLHALARSERDQLVITRQEEVARLLGYSAGETRNYTFPGEAPIPVPAVERFMADLYPALSVIRRTSDHIIRKISNSRLILGIGLDCKRRQIVPANSSLQADDPAWLLWMCELAQKYRLGFSEEIEHEAAALVEMKPIINERLPAAQVFCNVLARLEGLYLTVQKMADLGILGWFLPEFGPLMNLIPYDPSHDYTVGQHTLYIIKHLEALLQPINEEQTEMKRILTDLPHPEQLTLAVLLHDAGKAIPDRPHAETGATIAAAVCVRLGWSAEATANVCFLVKNHLLMAETSRLRDLNLDETLRDFTASVTDLDRLNMLYLLTYADTKSVGEGIWNQVKGRFLRELWQRAAAVLCDEESLELNDATVARARRRLLKDLSVEQIPESEIAEHIQSMPTNYLLSQDLKQMALHIDFVRRVRNGAPVIDFHGEPEATYTELTVCALDDPQPGLLAKIAGVLAAADLNVHSAQVVTRTSPSDQIALDTLWVDFRGRQLSAGKQREVTQNLSKVLSGERTVQDILDKRSPSTSRTPPEKRGDLAEQTALSIRHDLSDTSTVLELTIPDAPGAFYRFCDTFSKLGWDIESARVSTWKGQARATFYVSGCDNIKDEEKSRAIFTTLAAG